MAEGPDGDRHLRRREDEVEGAGFSVAAADISGMSFLEVSCLKRKREGFIYVRV